jgi:hypothetical protein
MASIQRRHHDDVENDVARPAALPHVPSVIGLRFAQQPRRFAAAAWSIRAATGTLPEPAATSATPAAGAI